MSIATSRTRGRRSASITLALLLVFSLCGYADTFASPVSASAETTDGGPAPIGKERDVPSFHDYPGAQANYGGLSYVNNDPGQYT
ncbi:hypothetical protein [Brooklawnia cerclae]|uniref:Uncharacterized protein n=1 Tax=Brooklawnia cerclae TaxID=349934 RepID=A0ABX0SHQ8_9ACTN|nr:hypothetical protein [Brooklawnia cerclae]NIH56595.1 hypothetical protein [Brooklawnia cerclae]